MGHIHRYDIKTGQSVSSGEMKLLNLRLKTYLDSHADKTAPEKTLAKCMNQQGYEVCIVGISDTKSIRDTFTLAMFKRVTGNDGQDYVDCRYLEGSMQGDLTHCKFNDTFSTFEELPKKTQEEINTVYNILYNPTASSDEYTSDDEYVPSEGNSDSEDTPPHLS
jgi:hypothetical protein